MKEPLDIMKMLKTTLLFVVAPLVCLSAGRTAEVKDGR